MPWARGCRRRAVGVTRPSQNLDPTSAGAELRDRRGRRITPLGLASIKKLIETLGSILEEAIEHIERNPARESRMRRRAPKPARTFLEMDELVALFDAAGEQDGPLVAVLDASSERLDGTRAEVARAAAQGMRSERGSLFSGAVRARRLARPRRAERWTR